MRMDDKIETPSSAVTRSLSLIEVVGLSEKPVTLNDLAERIDMPRATLHRLCQRLVEEGFLFREPDRRHYSVGPRLFKMGLTIVGSGVGTQRHAILKQVVDVTRETCNFVTRSGCDAIYLARVESDWPLRVHLEPGSRVPLHCTASGKLLLAHMDAQQRQKLLASLTFERFTPATIMSADALETEFAEILCDGYSTDREEFMMGLIAIAVPVFDRNGRVVASLACHAPKARMTLDDARRYVPVLQSAARKLAQTF
ncbi:IclR family transcriptional regulator [Sinorhizobium meliloti]|nr:IclR family transcriptional regulator [Sinorhizobium meliloti]ASQ01273.1 IclR family transcriptional regulator [Sinorhizobium meliloti]ASQ13255.1 IclR family transcriptional regulator [Sinorhizobium meliloti]MDW9370903.1 helix-turn-helix domain-containing protein [Sinorhizobium meliloti]MDW9388062.1 helix-turn-helix domain-containing protein [Sinorhizobium meliloti]